MNNRYLEISSAYRNRFEYPNPAKFMIMLAQSGNMFTAKKAYNPVSENTPCYNFQGFGKSNGILEGKKFGKDNLFGPGTPGIPNLGSYDSSVIPPLFTSDKQGYYNGVTLYDKTINESSMILNYNGIQKSCVLKNSFSDNWDSNNEWELRNTSIGTYYNTDEPKPRIITHGTPVEDGYFNDYVIEDLSLDPIAYPKINDRFKRIVKYCFRSQHAFIGRLYDGDTNIIDNNNGSGFPYNGPGAWKHTDLYRIRVSPPIVMGHGTYAVKGYNNINIKYNNSYGITGTGPENGSNGAVIDISIIDGGKGFTQNKVFRDTKIISKNGTGLEIEIINTYNGSISQANVVVPGKNYRGGSLIELKSPSNSQNAIIKILSTGQSIDITNGIKNKDKVSGNLSSIYNFYKNEILYIQSKGPESFLNNSKTGGPLYYKQLPMKLQQDISNDLFKSPPYSPNTTGCVIIDSYQTPTKNAKYSDDNSQVTETAWIVSSEPFSVPVTGNSPGKENSVSWEIQHFTKDSTSFLTYTGSTVSQNQMVCYEIRLVRLILPNVTLRNGIGGKISFYPYLYVELQNQTSPNGHQKNILYSNNPNAVTATFLVPIDNTPSPLISKFIHISGNGAAQTIKFKPNDNLSFRVYLSDGSDLVSIFPDNAPPESPNPYLQITALFDIRRLV